MSRRALAVLAALLLLSGLGTAFPAIGTAQEPDAVGQVEDSDAVAQAQAANEISAYGCTLDPMKPTNPDDELVAKAQFRCGRAMAGRAVRTELQQRREDGNWYTVYKSIAVRYVPDERDGQWFNANGDPARCENVEGTRKFRSVILVTDGDGNVTEAKSNPEEFGRDCVDADDSVPLVALVTGSNSLDVCESVEEILTDPAAEFTDPEVLFAQGNVEPCGGVVTSWVTPRPNAEWEIAVKGIGGLDRLPTARSAGGGTEISDHVALTGDNAQDQAAIEAKEKELLNTLSPDSESAEIQAAGDVSVQSHCAYGNVGDRRSSSSFTRNTEEDFGGRQDGPVFLTTVRYKRISCAVWQFTDVITRRTQGTWEVRLDSANYPVARQPGGIQWWNYGYSYRCRLMRLGDTIGWPNDQRWEFLPNALFSQGFYIRSSWRGFSSSDCNWRNVHMTSATRLRGEDR